ncbi:MAG TPA: anthranilate synthase component I [Planctomycetota bacterium]|nr:anthranilate synthase component I [Planctomycetota bacterium]
MTSIKVELKPTVREVAADLETPVSAFLKLKGHGARFLLESVEMGENLGRYSFIGLDHLRAIKILPEHVLVEEGGKSEIIPIGTRNPLEILRELMLPLGIQHDGLPGLVGGAVGYIGYDFVRFLEKLPARLPDTLGLPLCNFYLASTMVIFDHVKRKMLLVTVGKEDPKEKLDEVYEHLRAPLAAEWTQPRAAKKRATFTSEFPEEDFKAAVLKAKESIKIGDIFQVVLSQRQHGELSVEPFQVYRALRILNPSPYMFYLDFGDYQLVGSSPEIHAKLAGREAVIRPIAGTRRRGQTADEDQRLEKELLADEKERAEHLMLIDLARNDVGRCAEYGSVRCTDLYTIERYSHVMHIVSEVVGKLAAGQDQFSLLSNTFPAGTLTGAPKIRAMEIIEDLEKARRGPYGGTVGYFSLTGDMDTCITIRTMIVKGRTAYLQAGAGIVADSDPKSEWAETCAKMEVLKRAIALAEEGL